MAKKSLSDLIRAKRGLPPYRPIPKAAISLRVAAKQSGVNLRTLNRVERGGKPEAETLVRICAWLKVDPREVSL
jgi:transcriptional regulator with XRE-family HTH domain